MNQVTLTIPISKSLKDKAEKTAREYGFLTLAETVKKLLIKFSNRELVVEQEPEPVQLSPRAIKRYNKIIDRIDKGKGITKTKNLDELFALLDK
ncbi:MAG: hypothetical protein AAB874_03155 [Patescibacteria group bacterium]